MRITLTSKIILSLLLFLYLYISGLIFLYISTNILPLSQFIQKYVEETPKCTNVFLFSSILLLTFVTLFILIKFKKTIILKIYDFVFLVGFYYFYCIFFKPIISILSSIVFFKIWKDSRISLLKNVGLIMIIIVFAIFFGRSILTITNYFLLALIIILLDIFFVYSGALPISVSQTEYKLLLKVEFGDLKIMVGSGDLLLLFGYSLFFANNFSILNGFLSLLVGSMFLSLSPILLTRGKVLPATLLFLLPEILIGGIPLNM